ncbi:MAG: glycosyltransferase family 2 protein [Lachnospiraceae bacterium]|nr:glycosyltransferase family 2 protein [Lachnospiraceae bacterium]
MHFGPKEFWNHLLDRLEPEDVPYDGWFASHSSKEDELVRQRKSGLDAAEGAALFSVVVPAYCTPERALREMIESVRAQTYGKWELCIADASDREPDSPADGNLDKQERAAEKQAHFNKRAGKCTVKDVASSYASEDSRIRYMKLPANEGISANTNAAMQMASGDYICFLDHDDLLAPQALYLYAKEIKKSGADFLYSDEDKVTEDGKKHLQPHFKPDFNLDLLRSNNYITHFVAVRKSLADAIGGFRPEMDGAQDYDFIFRCTEAAGHIAHVPEILYHWRTSSSSTADNPMSKRYAYEAGKRAIEDHLKRCGTEGKVELLPDFGFYRVRYPVRNEPLVSVIIPNRDQADALRGCVESVLNASYSNLEIIIVENGSLERETFAYYKELSDDSRVRLLRWKRPFNYSAINNYGVKHARGRYLLFLNNDVRATISPDWLSEMLGVCQREDVGAVGARLYYPDGRIQHAGIVVGMGGVAGAMFVDLPKGRSGYMHKAALMQDLSAVTAACMMVDRDAFEDVGGFTEDLAVAFNDVDFCLKVGEAGYRVVYDPYAELYHDESRTRGPEDSPEKVRRFQDEIEYMRSHWTNILKNGDPNYNKNLSLKKWNYSLKP